MGRRRAELFEGINLNQGLCDEDAWRAGVAELVQEERGKRIRRNNPKLEEAGQESVGAVLSVLRTPEWFPWVLGVSETDRLGDDDWIEKIDAWVDLDPCVCRLGLPDQISLQIKSNWEDFSGLGNPGVKKILGLTSRDWRERYLVVVFGKARAEAIAASFCDQLVNYMEIAGVRQARRVFASFQTEALRSVLAGYEAQGIRERDWEGLLTWVAGRPKRTEYGPHGNRVVLLG